MKRILFFLLIAFFVFIPKSVFADYPNYNGYVNDFANVLSPTFVDQLDRKLADFDKKTTNEVAVLTVKTTQPEAIEDYSIHVADKWKVGQKGKDNGIIMLFAMDDRKMRIEVGRGLEGELTDIQTKHIQTDIIRPLFQKGQYEQGVDAGINAVISTISPQYTSSVSPYPAANTQTTRDSGLLPIIFFFIFLFVIGIGFSPFTMFGGRGRWGWTTLWGSSGNNGGGGDGFGGFGGGGFSGGGSSSGW